MSSNGVKIECYGDTDIEHFVLGLYAPVKVVSRDAVGSSGMRGSVTRVGGSRIEYHEIFGNFDLVSRDSLDDTIFLMVLRGGLELSFQNSDLHLETEMAAVYRDPRSVRMREGGRELSLIIPTAQLQAGVYRLLDGKAGRPLEFSKAALSASALSSFASALLGLESSPLVHLAEDVPGRRNGLEELIIDSLISKFPNNNSDLLEHVPHISPRQVKKALELIHGSPRRQKSPYELASASGVSTRALQYAFRRSTGRTISEYQILLRLKYARDDILRDRSNSIEAISSYWGFKSPSHFSQLFKRAYGISPSVLRQKHF